MFDFNFFAGMAVGLLLAAIVALCIAAWRRPVNTTAQHWAAYAHDTWLSALAYADEACGDDVRALILLHNRQTAVRMPAVTVADMCRAIPVACEYVRDNEKRKKAATDQALLGL